MAGLMTDHGADADKFTVRSGIPAVVVPCSAPSCSNLIGLVQPYTSSHPCVVTLCSVYFCNVSFGIMRSHDIHV